LDHLGRLSVVRLFIERQPADLVRLLGLELDPQHNLVIILENRIIDYGIKAIAAMDHTLHVTRIVMAQTGIFIVS
jgi:hypothetical protein